MKPTKPMNPTSLVDQETPLEDPGEEIRRGDVAAYLLTLKESVRRDQEKLNEISAHLTAVTEQLSELLEGLRQQATS